MVESSNLLHAIPAPITPFVGRQRELAEIHHLMQDPACRLLTLVGPGGVGKTRLVIQCAEQWISQFPHGIYFVDMQPVQSPKMVATAIADGINLHISSAQDLPKQLANFLSKRHLLLILDNMEHLLDGTSLLLELLQSAPYVKLLITSREALNLEPEWLYPVTGMSYPDHPQIENFENFSAVNLFAQRARRIRPDFSLSRERDGVIRICQLVEGLPLALDLAASWVNVLPCSEIASEIQQNLDFLTTRLRQAPAPHHSLRAVFEHSWRLLAKDEQQIFCQLAVFQGGFDRQAAQQIVGASLDTLSRLLDKSLLRLGALDRYYLHATLHQFAIEYLAADPSASQTVRKQHCEYFANFMDTSLEGLIGGAQVETLDRIQSDLDNVRVAWKNAMEDCNGPAIQKMSQTLSNYFQYRGRYQEPADALENALETLSPINNWAQRDEALGAIHMELSWLNIRFGRISKAAYHATQADELFTQASVTLPRGVGADPLLAFGLIAAIKGSYLEAANLYQKSYDKNSQLGYSENLAYACHGLSMTALEMGDLDAAERYARQGFRLCERHGEYWLRAYLLNQLGSIDMRRGISSSAEDYFQQSYAIRARFHDPEGMGVALNHLGEVYLQKQDIRAAVDSFTQSLDLYQDIGDRGGYAVAISGLGQTAVCQQQLDMARQYFIQALTTAAEIGYVPLIRSVLPWVERLLHHLQVTPVASPEDMAAMKPEAIAAMMDQLHTLTFSATGRQAPEAEHITSSPLLESLTDREIEILNCISKGLSNQEIAHALVISLGTVKWYTSQIYRKLQVDSRTKAVAISRQLNLL